MGTAVDIGGFLQRDRDIAVQKAVEHEDRHRHGKSGVHENQRQSVVQYVQRAAVNADERNHDRLEGDDHGSHHQGKGDVGNPVFMAHDIVG